jgi:hypothetical protein
MARAAAIFAILVGAAMVVLWAALLLTGNVPELTQTPLTITMHIAAESLTGVALIVGGVGLLMGRSWARPVHLSSLGMLVYAVVQATGYYAERHATAAAMGFVAVGVLAILFATRAGREIV